MPIVVSGIASISLLCLALLSHPVGDDGLDGSLRGIVRLAGSGPVPTSTAVPNTTDPEQCGTQHTLEDVLIDPDTRGIRNVILSIDGVPVGIPEEESTPDEPRRMVIDNVGCAFRPHTSVARVGDTIEALNSDSFLHTTHFYGPLAANLALPQKGSRVERTVSKPGLIVVKCDIHGWMQAFVRVDTHRFHTVSDLNGQFLIEEVPSGTYTLEVWHERFGPRKVAVRVQAGRTETIEIEYRNDSN